MKLVTRDPSNARLEQLKSLLEANGIPAFISGENTARLFPPIMMTQAGLWVYLDEQHRDAERLIQDPDHVVTTGVDVEAFYEAQPDEARAQDQLFSAFGKFAAYAVIALIFMFILLQILGG